MATVNDLAAYLLSKHGQMSAMKLQKLAYYSQAWSLALNEAPIFCNRIEAWANGPVVRDLYNQHRGQFLVSTWPGDTSALSPVEKATVDAVLEVYGDKSPQWLSDLTHAEAPWREARERAGLRPGERGEAEITQAAMAEYYATLAANQT